MKQDEALNAIPTPADRQEWLRISTAYKSAGGDYNTWDEWNQRGANYNERENRYTWDSIDKAGKITEATLYKIARDNGWTPTDNGEYDYRKKNTERKPAPITEQQTAGIEDYITNTGTHREEALPYWKSRGLSEESANRFNIGYDPQTEEVIIPYPGKQYYIARYTKTLPNTKGKRYRYPAGISKELFNTPALNAGNDCFITEGQIDAITLEQLGVSAVASNEPGQILSEIKASGTTVQRFFIIPDADGTGEAKAGKMRETLTGAGYEVYIYPLPNNYHDVNDFFSSDGADCYEWMRGAGGFADKIKAEAMEEYSRISGAKRLPELFKYIDDSAKRPVISTGFPTLDLELGDGGVIPGGLSAGLVTIGAISSLGKTTFVMQMADSIASQGQDVLIIALEMSAMELMAKSISRITVDTATKDSDRKTVQGILQGGRYAKYSQSEKQTITDATEQYRKIAKHVFIKEGIGTIGVAEIRQAIAKHAKIAGRAPVLVVDYLQILSPADPRATDKANTDTAVLEMKRISRDYDTPVICISSFNRSNYREEVRMEALKESGAIEYSSDVVIGLQLEGAGGKNFDVDSAKAETPRKIEAVILKNRSGKTGQKVKFDYDPRFNIFIDVMRGHRFREEDGVRSGDISNYVK